MTKAGTKERKRRSAPEVEPPRSAFKKYVAAVAIAIFVVGLLAILLAQ